MAAVDKPVVTTSQNPYGPPARPAQPYAHPSEPSFGVGPQTGPQRVGRHSAPATPLQAVWASGPQQQHRAPASHDYPRQGPGQGYARVPHTAAVVPPQLGTVGTRQNSGFASQGAGYAAPGAGYDRREAGYARQDVGFARPDAGHVRSPEPAPGRTETVADRVRQMSGAPGVPAQRSGENPVPQYPAGQQSRRTQPPRNGLGTTALVLGILAVLFAMIPIIGMIAWPLAILGLVFGLIGVARTRSDKADNKGVAISGTVLSAIGLILCIVWVAAFSSAMSSTAPTTDAVPASSGTTQSGTTQAGGAFPGATANDVVGNAGDTLTVGDMQISATALSPGDSTLGRTLCSTVTYRNTGSTPDSFNGGFDWKLQDPSGAALMTGFTGSNNMLSAGELAPGGTTSGQVCFDRNASASGQYVLLYDPMSFSATRGAWLNQVG